VEHYPEHGVDVLGVDGVGSIDDISARLLLALAR